MMAMQILMLLLLMMMMHTYRAYNELCCDLIVDRHLFAWWFCSLAVVLSLMRTRVDV